MKVLKLLVIFTCLLTSAQLYAQKTQTITISLKNVPLETVLAQIKKQTGVKFFYDKEVIKSAKRVSIQAEKADLETVLKQCLRNTSISFTIFDKTVVLSTKKDAAGKSSMDSSFFSKETVHGFIYNTQGQAMANANVIIKRSHQGTSTNVKGEFVLQNVRTSDTLRVSYMGYQSQERPVSEESEFNFYMKEAKNDLDAIIVQAYGTTTKRLVVGEITQINAEQIAKQPLTNPMLALNGLVPGLLVTPTSGYTGTPVRMEIRGRSSINVNATSDPLYVIDGVPLIMLNIAGALSRSSYLNGSSGLVQSGYSVSNGQSPFFSLNNNDIESITILKDGAATAMYGSRAGNGVILITTKKGKPGETQFTVSADQSLNRVIGHWDMPNTTQYLQMRQEALRNDGIIPTLATAPDLAMWDANRYTDWQKELWSTSKTTNIETSLSGGSAFTTFRIAGAYGLIRDLAIIGSETKNKRATLNLSLQHHSSNNKLSILFSAIYGYTNTDQRGSVSNVSTLSPNMPPVFDQNGNLNYAAWSAAGLGDYPYPFTSLLVPVVTSSYLLNSSLTVNYQIIKGLSINMRIGYNNSQLKNNASFSIASQDPLTDPEGSIILGRNENVGWNVNPEATYSSYIGRGKIDAIVGSTLNSTTASGLTTTGDGYTSDLLLNSITNAPGQRSIQTAAQNKYTDLHARVNYNWEDKYVVQITGDRDGSSSFGPRRQFGNFWSAGANWIVSEEKWAKKNLPLWISSIKLSGTYGLTGISGGDYQYLSQWSKGNMLNYNDISPLTPIHAVNQDYHWQTSKTLNTSFDLGLFSNRLNLKISHYRRRTNDQLERLPTPIFTGFNDIQGNSKANVQNTGWEGTIDANLINTKDFSWSVRFNISTNQNKLLAFPGIEYTSSYTRYVIGKSLNTFYVLHYLGVDAQTGKRGFEDYNYDGKISISSNGAPGSGTDDKYIPIDPTPRFYGGAGSNFTYKNIKLGVDLVFKTQRILAPYVDIAGKMINVPLSVLNNHWQKPGDIAANPRFTTIDTDNFGTSDGAYIDGSFLRLSNIYIGYSLPNNFSKRLGLKGLELAISMQNVLTLSKYTGIDPESRFGGLPQAKTFNGKITFNF